MVKPSGPRRRAGLLLGAGLYALLVVASPPLHHDLDCHLKSPSHCTACTANPLASRVERDVSLDAARLPVVGRVSTVGRPTPQTVSPVRLSGRSPPA